MTINPRESIIQSVASRDFDYNTTGHHIRTYFRNNTMSVIYVCDIDGNVLFELPPNTDYNHIRPNERGISVSISRFEKSEDVPLEKIPVKVSKFKISENDLNKDYSYIKKLQCIICTEHTKAKLIDRFVSTKGAGLKLLQDVIPILPYVIVGNIPEHVSRGYVLDHENNIKEIPIIHYYENMGFEEGEFRLYYTVSSVDDIDTLSGNEYYLKGNMKTSSIFDFLKKNKDNEICKDVILSFVKDKEFIMREKCLRDNRVYSDPDRILETKVSCDQVENDKIAQLEKLHEIEVEKLEKEIKKYKEDKDIMEQYNKKLKNDLKYYQKLQEEGAEQKYEWHKQKIEVERVKGKSLLMKTILDVSKFAISTILIAKLPLLKIARYVKTIFAKPAFA